MLLLQPQNVLSCISVNASLTAIIYMCLLFLRVSTVQYVRMFEQKLHASLHLTSPPHFPLPLSGLEIPSKCFQQVEQQVGVY